MPAFTSIKNIDKIHYSGGLPKEFEKLDYIRSNGEQYIDTGVKVSDLGTTAEWYLTMSLISGDNSYNGSYKQGSAFQIGLTYDLRAAFNYAFSGGTSYSGIQPNTWYTLYLSNGTQKVDNTVVGTQTTQNDLSDNPGNLLLFGRSEGSSKTLYNATIKRSTLYSNHVLIQDLVPAKAKMASKNLMDKNYYGNETINGITFTVRGDGSLVANGTATARVIKYIGYLHNLTGDYTFSGCPTTGSASTYYIEVAVKNSSSQEIDWPKDVGSGRTYNFDNNNAQVYIVVENGKTLNNVVFYPQFKQGTLVIPYEPYYEAGTVGLYDTVNSRFYINAGTGDFIAGDRVLDDFEELEYIESTGTQHIDTGVIGNLNTKAELDIQPVTLSTEKTISFFGDYTTSSKAISINLSADNAGRNSRFGNKIVNTVGAASAGNRYLVKIDKNKLSLNGTSLGNFDTTTSFTTDKNLFICKVNGLGDNYHNFTNRLFSCKLYSGSTILRDFMPARARKASRNLCDGIPQGYFINIAATGAGFTGTDKGIAIAVPGSSYTVSTKSTQARYRIACCNVLPTSRDASSVFNGVNKDETSDSVVINTAGYAYLIVDAEKPEDIQVELGSIATPYEPYYTEGTIGLYDKVNCRFYTNAGTGEFIAGFKEGEVKRAYAGDIIVYGLPTSFKELDYIESTGTQYIDTGIIPQFTDDFYLKYYPKNDDPVFGATNFTTARASGTDYWRIFSGSGAEVSATYEKNIWKEYKYTGATGIFTDGDQTLTRANTQCTDNLLLFKRPISATSANVIISSCKIKRNNILVRNFVPAKAKAASKNLLPRPTVTSKNGVNISYSSDGLITVSGVPDADWVTITPASNIIDQLEDGVEYIMYASDTPQGRPIFIEMRARRISDHGYDYVAVGPGQTVNRFTVRKNLHDEIVCRVLLNTRTVWGSQTKTYSSYFQLEKSHNFTSFQPYYEVGEVGLYDLRYNRFYINAGTGKFIAGGEIGDDWLRFSAEQANSTIALTAQDSPSAINLVYSRDGKTWYDYTIGSAITLINVGDKVFLKAKATNSTISTDEGYYKFVMTGRIKASGNIQYLLDSTGTRLDAPEYCYRHLFQNCTSLTETPELPATTLDYRCYYNTFQGCSNLVKGPSTLPATVLSEECYYNMFAQCESLILPPTLPATTLANGCYQSMFYDCYALSQAPALPATDVSPYGCYFYMFRNCSSLTAAPELPATTLGIDCYSHMFEGCTGIKHPPVLPATTLENGCYYGMFKGCTQLGWAPELPALILTRNCYREMFYGCTKVQLSTTFGGIYQLEYRIPEYGPGELGNSSTVDMFTNTGGTFTGTATINVRYYQAYNY